MQNCQIFTPPEIVDKMLDMIGYTNEQIESKTIFEPSFGDGAFLVPIVERILNYSKQHNKTTKEILSMLENVYGVELDEKYFAIAKERLQRLLEPFAIEYSWPNLRNEDTLTYVPPVLFDFCIGNPPYIRVHDCSPETRQIIKRDYMMGKGNTDLYVIFYEKGLNCLNDNGVLCYIAPNSYFKNSSQKAFRKYLVDNNLVEALIDYGEVRVFGDIDTYTAITKLSKNKQTSNVQYTMMKSLTEIDYQCSISLTNNKGSPWAFAKQEGLEFVQKIKDRTQKLDDLCEIQYGIATNADSIFVIGQDLANTLEPDVIRPIVKASKLKRGKYVIFPYQWDTQKERYIPIEEITFKEKYPKTYAYLLSHKDKLLTRDMEKGTPWFVYARSQGLQNSHNKKIALKHVLSPDKKTCEYLECDEKTMIYSGVYIIIKEPHDYEKVLKILRGTELYQYLFTLGKNMSGGYKSVNAKTIKSYGIPESIEKQVPINATEYIFFMLFFHAFINFLNLCLENIIALRYPTSSIL